MHCEDLFVNDSCDGQTVKAVSECLPQFNIKTTLAFVVKSVNTIDTCTLVVAAKDKEVLRILDLIGKQEADRLETLLSSVHIVTQEEIVSFWREASVFKQTKQVVVLTVNITCGISKRVTQGTYRKS